MSSEFEHHGACGMTPAELAAWASARQLEDTWLLRINGNELKDRVSSAWLVAHASDLASGSAEVLHPSLERDLNAPWQPVTVVRAIAATRPPLAPRGRSQTPASDVWAWCALAVPLLASYAMWTWAKSPFIAVDELATWKFFGFPLLAVALTAFLIHLDLAALATRTIEQAPSDGLFSQTLARATVAGANLDMAGLATLFAFGLFFPLYMYKRASLGGRNLMLPALIVAAIFAMTAKHVDDKLERGLEAMQHSLELELQRDALP
ncbi:MAG: hypothetical protein IPL79_18045 [Myxococcales bacterium]|nr:hypothetical protein [Myxococcales bacterium]